MPGLVGQVGQVLRHAKTFSSEGDIHSSLHAPSERCSLHAEAEGQAASRFS